MTCSFKKDRLELLTDFGMLLLERALEKEYVIKFIGMEKLITIYKILR